MSDDMLTIRHRLEGVRRWPDQCEVGVTRKDEYQPCDKPAVAAISMFFEGEWGTSACCAYHAHMLGNQPGCALVPLKGLLS